MATDASWQKRIAQEKYNEVRKRHALEFLKKIEDRLSSLSNQAVADLLRILIALGLDIEDEEELEVPVQEDVVQELKDKFEAVKIAADFTVASIQNTIGDDKHWYGVKFEPALPKLIELLNN